MNTPTPHQEVPPMLKYGGTAIYVDDVPAALDFYRRAFGLETRFFDEALQYGELQTDGAVVAFASTCSPRSFPDTLPTGMPCCDPGRLSIGRRSCTPGHQFCSCTAPPTGGWNRPILCAWQRCSWSTSIRSDW